MRLTTISVVVVFLSVAFANCAPNLPSEKGLSEVLIEPIPGEARSVNGCDFSESIDPKTFERSDYVKCIDSPKLQRFYQHHRTIGVTIDAAHRVVLINDCFSSKRSRVVIADLMHHPRRNIGWAAERLYKSEVNPSERVIVNPQGRAFSPDGRLVLIQISPSYFSISTAAEARKLGSKASLRWYAVESDNGRVLHEFTEAQAPQKWW